MGRLLVNWSELGAVAPAALEPARLLAHHGVQWVSRAARANLAAEPDDSHSNLGWDDDFGALVSHKLAGRDGPVRFGLRLADMSLFVSAAGGAPARIDLDGQSDAAVGIALDAALAEQGLAPATPVALPYARCRRMRWLAADPMMFPPPPWLWRNWRAGFRRLRKS